MSESTPESGSAPTTDGPAGEVSEEQAQALLADAVEQQEQEGRRDPAPASEKAAEPAPEASEEPFDLERAKEKIRKTNSENRGLRKQIEELTKQLQARVDPEEAKAAIALVEAERDRTIARLRFGYQYGLPEELIDRLQGETPEEIEADAKKLAALLPSANAALGRGGLDPTDEPQEIDPKKLAAQIPRHL